MMRRDEAGPLVCVLALNSYLSRPHHEQSKKMQQVIHYLIECVVQDAQISVCLFC